MKTGGMNMEQYVELSPREIQLGFVASCVEFVAEKLGKGYAEIYQRMKRADMLDNYIYKCYDTLHTESRENLTDSLIDLLRRREEGR